MPKTAKAPAAKAKTKVVECPMCGDPLEKDDETEKVAGVVYHSECAVAAKRAQTKTTGKTAAKAKPVVEDEDEEDDDEDEDEEDEEDEDEEEDEDDDEDEKPVAKKKAPAKKAPPAKKGKKVVDEEDEDDDEDEEEEDEEEDEDDDEDEDEEDEEEDEDDEDDDDEDEEPVKKGKKAPAKKPVATKKRAAADRDEKPTKGKAAAPDKKAGPPRKNYADESEWGNPTTPGSARWAVAEAMHEVTKKDLLNPKGPGSIKKIGSRANAIMKEYWALKENRKRAPETLKDAAALSVPWFVSAASPFDGATNKEHSTFRITGVKE